MIDIRLYTLLEVVKFNSYTRAAEHLSLTQPAVTQHIKQLEKELGIKIFYRVGKEIKPTLATTAFLIGLTFFIFISNLFCSLFLSYLRY